MKTKRMTRVFVMLLVLMASALGQDAWASTFSVYNSIDDWFTISRDQKGFAETVYYRAVSLSGYEGQHFNATYGSYTFRADEDTHTITVRSHTPADNYKYQSGTTRKIRFEVLDRGGFILCSCDRTFTTGINADNYTGIFNEQAVTVFSGEATVTEGGYGLEYYAVPMDDYFTATAPQPYLTYIRAQLRFFVDFEAKEKDDGYQYIQILVDQTTNCDSDAGDGDPGTLNLSTYMAGFEHEHGKANKNYAYYSFPYLESGNTYSTITTPWSDHGNTVGNLVKQKFADNSRASDGRIIIPTDFNTLGLRFNASGSGSDTWYAQNVTAHVQAYDETVPSPINADILLSQGRHAKGNIAYISVPFSEPVIVYGGNNLTLSTSWGAFKYVEGSGTNVLTFSGIITADAGTELTVRSLDHDGISASPSHYLTDLYGNKYQGNVSNPFSGVTVDDELTCTLDDFIQDSEGNYLISCVADLHGLASLVKAGNDCTGLTFRQTRNIANVGTTIPIGVNGDTRFNGTYNGDGYSISNLTINGNSLGTTNTETNCFVGLFGVTGENAVIQNVCLKSSTINGGFNTGGIVGYNYGTVRNCLVESSVTIGNYLNDCPLYHGGIAGRSHGVIEGCRSAAKLTVKSQGGNDYGGIVGLKSAGYIRNCLYTGSSSISNIGVFGAIAGAYRNNPGLFNNYFYTTNSDILVVGWSTTDVDGAYKALTITLEEGINIASDDITTYDVSGITAYGSSAIGYNNKIFSGATQTVTLEGGEDVLGFFVYDNDDNDISSTNLNGNILTMPEYDVTVKPRLRGVLYLGENNVQLVGGEDVEYTFTPAAGGWYRIWSENSPVGLEWLKKQEATGYWKLLYTIGNDINGVMDLTGGTTYTFKFRSSESANVSVFVKPVSEYTLNMVNNTGYNAYAKVLGDFIYQIYDQGSVAEGERVYLYAPGIPIYNTLSWTVTNADGLPVTVYEDANKYFIMPASDVTVTATRYDYAILYDASNNADLIYTLSSSGSGNVMISGRTLYRDGDWNTICLPFIIDDFTGTIFEGATVMSLSSSSFAVGVLTLDFTPVTSIKAGMPYIVKWDSGENIQDPLFENVRVMDGSINKKTDCVNFRSTYCPIQFDDGDKSILFMGAGSKLYYPAHDAYVNAFRAYFELKDDLIAGDPVSPVKEFVLNFDGETTTVKSLEDLDNLRFENEEWYSISGMKLDGKPSVPGIYINNGKKVIIK